MGQIEEKQAFSGRGLRVASASESKLAKWWKLVEETIEATFTRLARLMFLIASASIEHHRHANCGP